MKEFQFKGFVMNGFVMLFLHLIVMSAAVVACFLSQMLGLAVLGLVLAIIWFAFFAGYVKLEPNEARVMVFFGKYRGTFSETGYYWVNPLLTKKKLSLRARNLDVEPIKVNDKVGNPIMVGLVLVWRLKDTYKALFEIDSQTMAGVVSAALSSADHGRSGFGGAVVHIRLRCRSCRRQPRGLRDECPGEFREDTERRRPAPGGCGLQLRQQRGRPG